MTINRRQILATLTAVMVAPIRMAAIGLIGTWVVRCQNGHDNMVSNVTINHSCETRGCGIKSVSEGAAWVVCPRNKDHCDWVSGITKQHECETCGAQCRRG
jgi:hypothetical protein